METINNFTLIPLPVNELKIKFGKKHKIFATLQKISTDYAEDNSESINKLISYFNKKFNDESDEITLEDEKTFKKELSKLDQSFGIVFNELKNLEWNEQKDIYVKFYNDTKTLFLSSINDMFNEYSNRTDFNRRDILFYNYLKLLVNLYQDAVFTLRKSNKSNFGKNLGFSSYNLLYFSIPVYYYKHNQITDEELLDKLGTIGTHTMSYKHPVPKNVEKLLEISSNQSLC